MSEQPAAPSQAQLCDEFVSALREWEEAKEAEETYTADDLAVIFGGQPVAVFPDGSTTEKPGSYAELLYKELHGGKTRAEVEAQARQDAKARVVEEKQQKLESLREPILAMLVARNMRDEARHILAFFNCPSRKAAQTLHYDLVILKTHCKTSAQQGGHRQTGVQSEDGVDDPANWVNAKWIDNNATIKSGSVRSAISDGAEIKKRRPRGAEQQYFLPDIKAHFGNCVKQK